MDYGRIKEKSITKVLACMQTENRPISSFHITKSVMVNNKTVEKILKALISEGKVEKIDTSAGMMYALCKKDKNNN